MPKATKNHQVWIDIAPEIKSSELNLPYEMDVDFLYTLSRIRRASGVPLRFLSDARPVDKDIGASKSAHKERPCKAVDLRVKNAYERARLVFTAHAHGINRIGIYPGKTITISGKKYTDAGSVHLDDSSKNPSPRIWTRY